MLSFRPSSSFKSSDPTNKPHFSGFQHHRKEWNSYGDEATYLGRNPLYPDDSRFKDVFVTREHKNKLDQAFQDMVAAQNKYKQVQEDLLQEYAKQER